MAIKDPRTLEFWSEEERRAWQVMSPSVLEVYFAGAAAGRKALPPNVRMLISWDVIGDAAIRYLDQYRMGIFAKVNAVTRRKSVDIITRWIRSGEPLPALERALEHVFDAPRAERIAVTEVTRLYAEGNQAAWKSSGVVGANQWMTASDELVCPYCGPLAGMIVPLGEGFTTDGSGMGPTAPPLHTHCRCWLQPVVDTNLLRDNIRDILKEYE